MIKDNGFGIPANQKDKVFEKLFRADNIISKETDGTGLGLYLVKSIVNEAKRMIGFDSEENKGTAFTVKITLSGMKAKKGTKELT